jgi:hypothetical protein
MEVGRVARAPDAFLDAARCFALEGEPRLALAALDRTIDSGWTDVEQLERDADLVSARAESRWAEVLARARAAQSRDASIEAPALRRELLAMFAEDQDLRNKWVASQGDRAAYQRIGLQLYEVDRQHTAVVKAAIAEKGWLTERIVAEDGVEAAFILVLHADADPAFQKEVMTLMSELMKRGDARSKHHYAYLYDRLAVAEKRRQLYGTQFNGDEPFPIEDEANLDARRAEMGLSTMAEYRRGFGPMRRRRAAARSPTVRRDLVPGSAPMTARLRSVRTTGTRVAGD